MYNPKLGILNLNEIPNPKVQIEEVVNKFGLAYDPGKGTLYFKDKDGNIQKKEDQSIRFCV